MRVGASKKIVSRIRGILLTDYGEMHMSAKAALAIVYLIQFILGDAPLPHPIERRWSEVGVLTEHGLPNAAMKNWAQHLTAGSESEEVLRGILMILGVVFDSARPGINTD
jgi:hypothetical protein